MKQFTLFAALCACTAGHAFGALVTEVAGGAGNAIGTAQAIAASDFTASIPATVFPGLSPTALVRGALQGNNDVDFYSFSLLASSTVNFDMDNSGYAFVDTMLSLFDSTGTLLAYDDDILPTALDLGSTVKQDAYLGAIALAAGTYYIAVSRWPNFATATISGGPGLVRPDGSFGGNLVVGATPGDSSFGNNTVELAGVASGSAYDLYISLNTVPEPTSMGLIGFGMMLVGLTHRRLRR